MIKVFLKHWIYEFFIYQVFDAIGKNFSAPRDIHSVSVGDVFSYIAIRTDALEIRYYDPMVVAVNDAFITIEGNSYSETWIEEKLTEYYDGNHFEVEIYKNDRTVKYMEPL